MLDSMRNTRSWLVYSIFGVLAFVFAISFGPGAEGCSSGPINSVAVTVNGDVIRIDEYARAADTYVTARTRGLPPDLVTEAMREELRRQVVEGMIEERLILQEAKRRGLKVSDDAVREYIRNDLPTEVLEDYENKLRSRYGLTPADYENQVREQLLSQQFQQIFTESVGVSELEAKDAFLRDRDRVKYQVLRFPIREDARAEASEEQLQALKDDEAALKKFYEENRFRYREPEKRRALHIVRALPEGTSEAEAESARNELVAWLNGAAPKNGFEEEAFRKLATAHSQDPRTKESGGDLGLHPKGTYAPALESAIFSLEVGMTTPEPVRTKQGWHMVRLAEVEEARDQSFDEARNAAALDLFRQKQGELAAKARAEKVLASLKAGGDIEDLSWTYQERQEARSSSTEAGEKFDPEAKPVRDETSWVRRSEPELPYLGDSEAARNLVFSLDLERPLAETPLTGADGRNVFVLRLTDKEVPNLEVFEEEKTYLIETKRNEKAAELLRALIDELKASATIKYNPAHFAGRASAA